MPSQFLTALGLMSGTSCDGIDAAIIVTDGESVREIGPCHYRPYSNYERGKLKGALKTASMWPAKTSVPEDIAAAERMLTAAHAEAVEALLQANAIAPGKIDVIGFHGQTVLHKPKAHRTVQIGDGAALAKAIGIDTVYDFRSADVEAGGQGAPLAPLYHAARARGIEGSPLVVVNIGGVSNVTWIRGKEVIAFDCGPGNAPIDDWLTKHTGKSFDEDGALATKGRIDLARIAKALEDPFFAAKPPKSLDRQSFTMHLADGLSPEDGAATLTAFTAATIARASQHYPAPAARILVTGGGRHNGVLMREIAKLTNLPVEPVEAVGWRGDMIEAEAFAFLAVRHLRGLPLSLPSTTGVPRPMTGGQLAKAR